MNHEHHSDVEPGKLTLRDRLAIDRTTLANERTLLAYVRTGLAVCVVGGTLTQLVRTTVAAVFGWVGVAGGLVIVAVGFRRFLALHGRLRAAVEPAAGARPER